MEIDITTLSDMNAFPPFHSAMEGGPDAGRNAWQAAKEIAQEKFILNTPEKLAAMREFAAESGGWTREEIADWPDSEVNALFLQWIAGDVRELGADSLAEIDWNEAEEQQSAGQAASNLFRGDDGKIYFYLGN